MKGNWFHKYSIPIIIGGVLFGLIIFVDVFRSEGWAKAVFDFFNRQAMVLSAAASVTLAAAAVWSVRTIADQTRMMIDENRRIRKEDKELDARTHALDEILHWAEETYATLIITTTDVDSLQSEQRLILIKLASTGARVSLVREYSEWLGEQLAGQFDATLEAFSSFLDVLNEDVNKIVTLGDEWPTQAFNNSLEELRNCLKLITLFACLERVGLHSEMTS